MTAETETLERLLSHAEWMRSLARQLVGTAAADDVVQETLIAAMTSPPDADRPARPWLARVMRNVTRMRFRADARRARREHASIDVAETPSPAAHVQRLETHRALCELVLGLDEPFRQTLVHHYFDGQTLAAIARAHGIPEGTVRWRHKTALERLRTRLDERAGGDRRAWVAGLAPLTAMPSKTASLVAGGLLVNKLVIGSVVVVAGGMIAWGVSSRAAPSVQQATRRAEANAAQVPLAPARSVPQHTRQFAATERQQIANQIATAQAAHHAATTSATATTAPALGAAPSEDLDKEVIRSAMREVIPFLQACYEQALPTLTSHDLSIKAHLMLTGDADVGTLIDADKLTDENGQTLPTGLDDCLRSTFQTLELPPIATGSTVEVLYPFVFRDGTDEP